MLEPALFLSLVFFCPLYNDKAKMVGSTNKTKYGEEVLCFSQVGLTIVLEYQITVANIKNN
jgi:hypothetical protein